MTAIGKTAFDKYGFEGYVDGKDSKLYEEISRNNQDDVTETGNGALTQVFVDSDAEKSLSPSSTPIWLTLRPTTTQRRTRFPLISTAWASFAMFLARTSLLRTSLRAILSW